MFVPRLPFQRKLPALVLSAISVAALPVAGLFSASAAPAYAAQNQTHKKHKAAAPKRESKAKSAPHAQIAELVRIDFSAPESFSYGLNADEMNRLLGRNPALNSIKSLNIPFAPAEASISPFSAAQVYAEPGVAAALVHFYRAKPEFLWSDAQGRIRPQARELLSYFTQAADDGLNPTDYAVPLPAEQTASDTERGQARAQFDLALSARLLRYISDMNSGRVRPAAFPATYSLPPKTPDLEAALAKTAASAAPAEILAGYRPQMPDYAALRQEMISLNTQSGGDNAAMGAKKQAVRNALERLRWMPENSFSGDYILANIPAFSASFYENGKEKLSMKTVVGSPARQTAIFISKVDRVIFNPAWGVPYSIMKNEMISKIEKDPSYTARHNYEVFRGSKRVDAASVNWAEAVRTGNVHIRQKPGTGNALGKLKILFPNNDNIYMHDTPVKSAFGRDFRALSHGCVRLSQPEDMAAAVLGTDKAHLAPYFKRQENGIIPRRSVAVYLAYFTAWPQPDIGQAVGAVHYYKDIYGLDAPLAKAEDAVSASRAKGNLESFLPDVHATSKTGKTEQITANKNRAEEKTPAAQTNALSAREPVSPEKGKAPALSEQDNIKTSSITAETKTASLSLAETEKPH